MTRQVSVVERKYWWRVRLGQASVLVWKQPPAHIECDQRMSPTLPVSEIDNMITCLRIAKDIATKLP